MDLDHRGEAGETAVPVEQGSGMRNALAYGMPNKRGLIMALYVVCRPQINFNIIVRVVEAHKLVFPFSMDSLQCTEPII
jgi:hypothetical protein